MSKGSLLTGLIAAVLLLSLAPVGTGLAQTNTGTAVAGGLNAPRGLSMGSDGNLWVAEAGTGGDQTVTVGDMTLKVGMTGRITKIAPDGTKSVVVDGLLSGDNAGEVGGPNAAIYANGSLWITGLYLGANPGPPSFGLLKANPATGAVTPVADLSAWEAANNPDGFSVESNPYGLALGPDGMIYVNDAAGNSLVKVDPATGNVSLVTVFNGIPLPVSPETANPNRGGANESDPVPTGISFASDGHAFVGYLTGFPFTEGAARVVHVDHDGEVSDAATGLTMVVDVEIGLNDEIYASEFGRFSFTGGPPGFVADSGQVVRIDVNGTRTVIASGLNQANGIALDKSGNLYVVVNSNGPAGTGQVLRFSTTGGAGNVGMPRTGANDMVWLPFAVLALLLVLVGITARTRSRSQT